jgi:hypothetical protein
MVAIIQPSCFIPPVFSARVAELVDAHDSGSCGGNPVEVRFLSRAPLKKPFLFKISLGYHIELDAFCGSFLLPLV